MARWKEHFEETLNRPVPDNPIEIQEFIGAALDEIHTGHITKEEI